MAFFAKPDGRPGGTLQVDENGIPLANQETMPWGNIRPWHLQPKQTLYEYPDGMSPQEAEAAGLAVPVSNPEVAYNAYASGLVTDVSGNPIQVSREDLETPEFLDFYTNIPPEEINNFLSNSQPVYDEEGNLVGRSSEEQQDDIEEDEELDPADELAQQILDGELSPYSYVDPSTGQIVGAGQPGSPLSGSMATAPTPTSAYAGTPMGTVYGGPEIGVAGYDPIVSGSMLKGPQYNLPSPQYVDAPVPLDANNDGAISEEEVIANLEAAFDPNSPEALSEEQQLEIVAKYPHLFYDMEDPNSWLVSPRERMIATVGDDYVNQYGDWFGQGLDSLPEGLPPPPDILTEQGRYVPVNAPGNAYLIYHQALRSGNAPVAQAILNMHGVDGPVLIDVGDSVDDYFYDDLNATPWSDPSLDRGELPNVQNPPPWHPEHNSSLDIMGRPTSEGGLSWSGWLKLNNLNPETGMPVNPEWDGQFNVPLTADLLGPDWALDFNEAAPRLDPANPSLNPDNFPGVGPSPEEDPSLYPTTPNYPSGAQEQNDQAASSRSYQLGNQAASAPPTQVSNALPPLDIGSGKGQPFQQLMPQQPTYIDPAQPAIQSPLQGSISAPADGGQQAQQRTLFPRRF